MMCSKARSAVILLVLLACGVSLGSVRMTGLSPGLMDIVDDPVNDMLSYPQLNSLEQGWLTGVELSQFGDYYLLAKIPGRLSVSGALDAELLETSADGDPSLAVAWQAGKVALGVSATVWAINLRPRPWNDLKGDTAEHWISSGFGLGEGTIGCRWSGPGFALDGNVDVFMTRDYWWRGTLDSFVVCGDGGSTVLTPVLRATVPRGNVCWRGIVSYAQTFYRENFYDSLKGRFYQRRETWHQLGLTGGLVFTPRPSFLVTAGLRSRLSPAAHSWWWNFLLPVGFEWNNGPLTVRMGVEAEATFSTAAWRQGSVKTEFYNTTYFGLGIRPLPGVSLDFSPYMEDIASLRGWKVGATIKL